MILMPLTFSISTGLPVRFLSYLVIAVFCVDVKKVSPVIWLVGLLSAVNLLISMSR